MLSLTLLLGSCASVDYGRPPMPPSDPRARCHYDRSIAIVSGSSTTQIVDDSGMRVAWSPVTGTSISYAGPQVTHLAGGAGYSLFLGERRLEPREGLELLGDPRLVSRYDEDLDRYSSGRLHVWARPLWITMIAGGVGLVIAGSVTALGVTPDAEGNSDYGVPLTLLAASLAPLLGSIPFLLIDFSNRDEEAELDRREALLVPDEEMSRALESALREHNDRAMKSCGP
jgi:hypothetical protein